MPIIRHSLPNLLLAFGLVLTGAGAGAQQSDGERPPLPVTVLTLEARDVLLTATLPGRVTASGVAEVRPRVSGLVTERLFEEGKPIAEGDPLYRIDPATYEAQRRRQRRAWRGRRPSCGRLSGRKSGSRNCATAMFPASDPSTMPLPPAMWPRRR